MAHDTTEMRVGDKPRVVLGVSTWVAIGGFVLALLGGGSALLTQLFTPQSAFHQHEVANAQAWNDVTMAAEKLKGTNELRDWKIQAIQVEVGNLTARQQRMDHNIVVLMSRMGAKPAPEPTYQEPPPAPAPQP